MNLCRDCGYEIYPSNGEDRCRLCRKNIRGFAVGEVLYFDEPLTECLPDPLAKKRRAA